MPVNVGLTKILSFSTHLVFPNSLHPPSTLKPRKSIQSLFETCPNLSLAVSHPISILLSQHPPTSYTRSPPLSPRFSRLFAPMHTILPPVVNPSSLYQPLEHSTTRHPAPETPLPPLLSSSPLPSSVPIATRATLQRAHKSTFPHFQSTVACSCLCTCAATLI